jgi:hypothetical protein
MYSNLSMAIAQEHHRDLLREAKAANLARSAARRDEAKAASPRFPRITFSWTLRRPATELAAGRVLER